MADQPSKSCSIKVAAIITAAGEGRRMGREIPKQFLEIQGKPVFLYSLEKFDRCLYVDEIILVINENFMNKVKEDLTKWPLNKPVNIVAGGEKRQDSVANGLDLVSNDVDIVLIHDGVRPFISIEKIQDIIEAVCDYDAALLAVPEKCTLKKVKDGWVEDTIDRKRIWKAQTPQGFRLELLRRAFKKAEEEGYYSTDESSLIERLGCRIRIVQGEDFNFKITSPEDLTMANALIRNNEK
jgi:2-C-methyl-D-erythritol 4-phosphate cytidylyltransferase